MPTASQPDVSALLAESEALVFNLDKCHYASDLTSIEALPQAAERHSLLRVDLSDAEATADAVRQRSPGKRLAPQHIWCAAATRSAQLRQHPHPLAAQQDPRGLPPEPPGPPAGTSPGAADSLTRPAPPTPARTAALRPPP